MSLVSARMDAPHIDENPFFVLDLPIDCGAMDIERAGQKLLAMLKVGMKDAASYRTPLGPRQRDEDAVRRAMAALREPQARAMAEFWARPEVWEPVHETRLPVWSDAHKRLGTLDR